MCISSQKPAEGLTGGFKGILEQAEGLYLGNPSRQASSRAGIARLGIRDVPPNFFTSPMPKQSHKTGFLAKLARKTSLLPCRPFLGEALTV